MIQQSKEDTVICISFTRASVSGSLVNYLNNEPPSYLKKHRDWEDQEQDEHMYGLGHIEDWMERKNVSQVAKDEIKQIRTLMDEQEASYFRLID